MSAQPKIYQIVARYATSKTSLFPMCKKCKHHLKGCKLKGRHVDAVTECFMFGMDKKKGSKG